MGLTERLCGGKTQVIIVALLAFSCPGMFNAMNGLGGAGSTDPTTANNTNTALYACFAIFGYFGGMFFNLFGQYGNRILMGCGGLTYGLYSLGQWLAAKHKDTGSWDWFAILTGGLLGVGAGFFWTAQGAMMMSYSPEDKKGTYISIFWVIFNLGGVLGGLFTFGINFNTEGGNASDATYFLFTGIMTFGSICAFIFLVCPKDVIREDGEPVELAKAPSPMVELKNVALMFLNKHMLLLTPLFASSNFFYSYQFNAVNGGLFTIRARGLNSSLYWGSQMLGAYVLGQVFLDNPKITRRRRAITGMWILVALFTVAWAMGTYLQLGWEGGFDKPGYCQVNLNATPPENCAGKKLRIDITDGGRYIYPIIVFLLYGVGDAMLQTYAYWLMGAITNDLSQLARFSGYYKGVQSGCAAIAWQLDNRTNWVVQLFVNWGLFTASIPFMAVVVYRHVTNSSKDDTAASSINMSGKGKMDNL